MLQKILTLSKYSLLYLLLCVGSLSCTAVQPYEKAYLNDKDMQQGGSLTDQMDDFQNYREGASGGNSIGNTGGGCGCN